MEDPEDLLINACEMLGWGLEINALRGYVEINTGTAQQRATPTPSSISCPTRWTRTRPLRGCAPRASSLWCRRWRRGDNGGTVRAIRQVQQQQDAHVRTHAAGKAAFVARMAAARRAGL
jgi:hypothetical protein